MGMMLHTWMLRLAIISLYGTTGMAYSTKDDLSNLAKITSGSEKTQGIKLPIVGKNN